MVRSSAPPGLTSAAPAIAGSHAEDMPAPTTAVALNRSLPRDICCSPPHDESRQQQFLSLVQPAYGRASNASGGKALSLSFAHPVHPRVLGQEAGHPIEVRLI